MPTLQKYTIARRRQLVSDKNFNYRKRLMRIVCSNCRANCIRLLLTGSVKAIVTSDEPPLAASLRSDTDSRICLAQAPSIESQLRGAKTSEQSARS
jgi:hypothetical protein